MPTATTESAPRAARAVTALPALLVMGGSGCAALGYQIVWTQQAALWLGHEGTAALAVLAAFFGGLALGAALLSRRVEASPRPARWYAACEALIGCWGLVLAFGMAPAGAALQGLVGAEPSAPWLWAVTFVGSFVLLLPATAAMGATLPAMERLCAQWRTQGLDIAALYAANTAGALLGVLGVAFVLVPALGLRSAAALCALLNGACALQAWRWAASAGPAVAAPDRPPQAPGAARLRLLLAATGLLGIGYEVLVLRVLGQVAENTVFTFALLLAVYLLGTALGAAASARNGNADDARRDRLLLALVLATLLGSASLWAAEWLRASVTQALGGSYGAALAAEAALALAAFALPTLVMGALFSLLCRQARATGLGLGSALGLNTAAAAAAPLLFGVLLLPALGAKAALLLVSAAYAMLVSPGLWRRPALPALALAGAVAAAAAPALVFVQVPEGGRIVRYDEGAMATVSVVEDAEGTAVLRINNRQQEGSSATGPADARQALLPLLLHAAPQRALFLGLGTGVTASAAALDPALRVDVVELLPGVIDASAHFAAVLGEPALQSRLHLHAADARRFVRLPGPAYDVIVADNFHPARSGSAALYTPEHFEAVRQRLAPSGLFCQWLPLHQLDEASTRSIVRSFLAVYPDALALLATNSLQTPVLGLLGRRDGRPFDPQALQARLAAAAPPMRAAGFGIPDARALLGSFVAGPRALQRYAHDAPLNTDDRPVVAYLAPRIAYAPDSTPAERLLALLHTVDVSPADVLGDLADSTARQRLAAYWLARNRFIEAGLRVQPTADVRGMLAQVREPLLAVLRTSPDFGPAYEPLRRMGQALQAVDPDAARDLAEAVQQASAAR